MAPDRSPDRRGRLIELAVTDLALIDRLRLALEAGFNVLTGETGAGKSLLIDALGLALGARADTALVRHGADTARVEALFDRLPEPLIAVREVAVSGRTTARLDDETVTAGRLAAATGALVEIHGQHDQQRLLDEGWQRDLLDAFGGHEESRGRVSGAVDRWRANRASLAELAVDPRELLRRLELLEHEAAEIGAAGLRDGEASEITRSWRSRSTARRSRPGQGTPRDPAGEGAALGSGWPGRARAARPGPPGRSLGPLASRLAGWMPR